jgi:hypothetical protein
MHSLSLRPKFRLYINGKEYLEVFKSGVILTINKTLLRKFLHREVTGLSLMEHL